MVSWYHLKKKRICISGNKTWFYGTCNLNNIESDKCECEQYIPNGNVCECGHSELWHKQNNKITDMIKYDNEIKKRIYQYIKSLNIQIFKLQNENKMLLEKCVVLDLKET